MATRAPSPKTSPAKKSPVASTARTARAKDACDLLEADHKAVRKLFDEYRTLAGSRARSAVAKKQELAAQICMELTVHAQLEEEIFYPAARGVVKDKSLLNEASVEHASTKDLITQIRAMDASDALFDAKVLVLGEYVDHHVKEERNELFPKVRESRLNLLALREELAQRKEQLMSEMQEVGEPEMV